MSGIIVGVNGLLRSGKSTFSGFLKMALERRLYEVRIVPFAEPLKKLCVEQFGWDGEKDQRGRRLLQVVGTDAGRAYNPRIWVDKWANRVTEIRRFAQKRFAVIADDCRFPNEAEIIHSLGGTVIQIDRSDHTPEMADHASEQPLPRESVDLFYSYPGGALEEMRAAAEKLAARLDGGQ